MKDFLKNGSKIKILKILKILISYDVARLDLIPPMGNQIKKMGILVDNLKNKDNPNKDDAPRN